MANPYIARSKLTAHEVEAMVAGLVCFNTYGEIATAIRRSPQALRPALVQIERRMYFECDGWPIFHLFQLSSYNPNRKHIPYINEIPNIIECVLRMPRAKNRLGMRQSGPELSFEAELDCLFTCPQHLPPREFVKRYGLARPINNFKPHPLEQECRTRIGLKKSCSSCKGTLRDTALIQRTHFFRFSMEYAARFGKPAQQYTDLFIARMAYFLVWRAFELNADHFVSARLVLHRSHSASLPPEKRMEFIKNRAVGDGKYAKAVIAAARNQVMNIILDDLTKNPIRVDRRGNYKNSL